MTSSVAQYIYIAVFGLSVATGIAYFVNEGFRGRLGSAVAGVVASLYVLSLGMLAQQPLQYRAMHFRPMDGSDVAFAMNLTTISLWMVSMLSFAVLVSLIVRIIRHQRRRRPLIKILSREPFNGGNFGGNRSLVAIRLDAQKRPAAPEHTILGRA